MKLFNIFFSVSGDVTKSERERSGGKFYLKLYIISQVNNNSDEKL